MFKNIQAGLVESQGILLNVPKTQEELYCKEIPWNSNFNKSFSEKIWEIFEAKQKTISIKYVTSAKAKCQAKNVEISTQLSEAKKCLT